MESRIVLVLVVFFNVSKPTGKPDPMSWRILLWVELGSDLTKNLCKNKDIKIELEIPVITQKSIICFLKNDRL